MNCILIYNGININNIEINDDYVILPSGNSAPLKHLWNRTRIYATSRDLALDSVDNIYVSGHDDINGRMYKYDNNGSLKWSTDFPYAYDSSMSTLAVDSYDNIYIGGAQQYPSDWPVTTLLAKYNNLGDLIWYTPPADDQGNTFGIGDPWGAGVLLGMTIDPMDNIYVCGESRVEGNPMSLLLKYNISGTLKWARTWNGDSVRDLEVDSLGNIYAISDMGDFTKWDSSGNLIWQQNYYDGYGNSLELDTLNNIYIVGKQTLRKYNSSGNLQWTVLFPENTWYDDLTLDQLEDIYITGSGDSGHLIITKYDKYGNYQWNWTWGSNFVMRKTNSDIIFNKEGNLLISGDLIIDSRVYHGLFKFKSLPQIAIYTPKSGEYFGVKPPKFDISILKGENCTIWYNLNSGIKNYINTYSGEINQTEWNKIGEGLVNLTFYVLISSSGFKAYSDVLLFKDLTAPTSNIYYKIYKEPNIVNQSTYFMINASDNSGTGVSKIQYRINDSSWVDYHGIFTLEDLKSGYYLLSYRSIDYVGNVEEPNSILVELIQIINPTISSYNILLLLAIILMISLAKIRTSLEKIFK